jgi:hypothetical protein
MSAEREKMFIICERFDKQTLFRAEAALIATGTDCAPVSEF